MKNYRLIVANPSHSETWLEYDCSHSDGSVDILEISETDEYKEFTVAIGARCEYEIYDLDTEATIKIPHSDMDWETGTYPTVDDYVTFDLDCSIYTSFEVVVKIFNDGTSSSEIKLDTLQFDDLSYRLSSTFSRYTEDYEYEKDELIEWSEVADALLEDEEFIEDHKLFARHLIFKLEEIEE